MVPNGGVVSDQLNVAFSYSQSSSFQGVEESEDGSYFYVLGEFPTKYELESWKRLGLVVTYSKGYEFEPDGGYTINNHEIRSALLPVFRKVLDLRPEVPNPYYDPDGITVESYEKMLPPYVILYADHQKKKFEVLNNGIFDGSTIVAATDRSGRGQSSRVLFLSK